MKIDLSKTLALIAAGSAAVSCSSHSVQKDNQRPNIIYIMSDDHGYQAISAYGYGLNKTPNIDRIAKGRSHIQPLLCHQFPLCPEQGGSAHRETQFYQREGG